VADRLINHWRTIKSMRPDKQIQKHAKQWNSMRLCGRDGDGQMDARRAEDLDVSGASNPEAAIHYRRVNHAAT